MAKKGVLEEAAGQQMSERGRGPVVDADGGAVWAEKGSGGRGSEGCSHKEVTSLPPAPSADGVLSWRSARVVFSARCQLRPGLLGKEATPFSAPPTTGPGVLCLQ